MSRVRTLLARAARTRPAGTLLRPLRHVARAPAASFAVLTYHRVDEPSARPWLYPALLSATPAGFAAQIAELARHYRIVSMSDLLAAMRGEAKLPPQALLISFDDAYRDFLENAWPVMRRLGLPVTLFVPTAFPGSRDRAFWWDRLWQAVTEADERAAVEAALRHVQLKGAHSRERAARALVQHCKSLPHEAALETVDDLCARLNSAEPRSEVLSWDDLRLLAAEGVELAVHSRNHPLLTRVRKDILVGELDGARNDLLATVGQQAQGGVFAYPGGEHDDTVVRTMAELGFEAAFTTQRGINDLNRTDRLKLRRMNVGMAANAQLIALQLAMNTLRFRVVER